MFDILSLTTGLCALKFVTFPLKMGRAVSIAFCTLIKAPPGKVVHIPHCKRPDPQGQFKTLKNPRKIMIAF